MKRSYLRLLACPLAVLATVFASLAMPRPAAATEEPWAIDPAWTAPIPDEARVVAADASGVIAVGRGGEVQSFDANGTQRWLVDIGQATTVDPIALDANLVVVPSDYESFVALDRATGARRWVHPAQHAQWANIGIDATGHPIVTALTALGRLDVLDGLTGALRWTVALPFDHNTLTARAWVVEGRVVVAWGSVYNLKVRAFDAGDGRLMWTADAPISATLPAVNADSVVFAENVKRVGKYGMISRVRSIDAATGATRWSRRVHGAFWPRFDVAADAAGVAVVDARGTITLLDANTGRIRWRRATKRRQLEVSPRLLGQVVAITTYGTGLQALSRSDGSALANAMPGPVQYSATIEASAVAGDRLYLVVQSYDGQAQVWALSPVFASG